ELLEALRKANVIANRQAEFDAIHIRDDHLGPGPHRVRFAIAQAVGRDNIEQVDLAIAGDFPAGRIEYHRGVEYFLTIRGALVEAARMHVDLVVRRELATHGPGRAVPLAFASRHLVGRAASRPVEMLRKRYELRLLRRDGGPRETVRVVDILALVRHGIHLNQTDFHDFS